MNRIHTNTTPQSNAADDTAAFIDWSVPQGAVVGTNTHEALPEHMRPLVDDDGPLSEHERAVAGMLAERTNRLELTSADIELDLSPINAWLAVARQEGQMLTLLHLAIAAAGRALVQFPRLRSIHAGRTIYRYKDCSVGFIVKSVKGDLFAPVIQSSDLKSVQEIARQVQGLTMKINRGTIGHENLRGACFSISHIASPVLHSFKALPGVGQSAMCTIAGERTRLALINGRCVEVPVCTVSLIYDQVLCDGMYVAEFLAAFVSAFNKLCL
jgi:2-oxoglutarate dehydrogenase E2 component (dihydrolipoamide succinyltransferase)